MSFFVGLLFICESIVNILRIKHSLALCSKTKLAVYLDSIFWTLMTQKLYRIMMPYNIYHF